MAEKLIVVEKEPEQNAQKKLELFISALTLTYISHEFRGQ